MSSWMCRASRWKHQTSRCLKLLCGDFLHHAGQQCCLLGRLIHAAHAFCYETLDMHILFCEAHILQHSHLNFMQPLLGM